MPLGTEERAANISITELAVGWWGAGLLARTSNLNPGCGDQTLLHFFQ